MANDLTLSVRLTGDGQQLTGTLQAASGEIRQFGTAGRSAGEVVSQGMDRGTVSARGFSRATQQNSRELQALRRLAAPLGAALAGVFATRTLQNQIAFGERLLQLNTRIGAGVEALSEYQYVADQAGVAFDTLATAWQRQTRRVAEAAQGTGAAKNALEALNLSAETLNRLAPEDAFERIAEALASVESQADRTALAMQLWDTEGVALLQIVNQGTDAIRTQRDEAERLGLTISQDTAVAMAGYSTEMSRLQAVGTGLSRQLAAELVPALTSGLQTTSAWVDQMGGTAEILDTVTDAATGVAIVLAGRYAGAIAASQAALTAKTAVATTATGTLNLLTGATTRQAAAATAMAGANRVAASALALFGGPVGVAVVAAGALYYFREELGLVDRSAENAAGAIAASSATIRDGSSAAMSASYENLRLELESVSLQAQDAMAQLLRLEAAEVFSRQGGDNPAVTDGIRQQISELHNELSDLWGVQVDIQRAMRENKKAREALTNAESNAVDTGEILVKITRDLADETKEAAKTAEELTRNYQTLRDRIRPLEASQRRYAQDKATLVAWALRENLATAELQGLLRDLEQDYRSTADAVEVYGFTGQLAATEMSDAAQEMARSWEEAGNRLDKTFTDAFTGAFDSFEAFADQMLGGFKRLLAELAYQATLRPIVVGFTGQMQGAMGLGGGGGNMGSVAGGFAEVGENIVSMGQTAYKGYQWLTGSGAAASQTGAAAVGYGGTGWASQVNAGGYGGSGWAGHVTSGSAGGGFAGGMPSWAGGTGAPTGWASGVATAGAGMAGGYLGNQVFGGGGYSDVGASAGAIAGAYIGSIVPVIGNYLGAAIGSFIGSGLGSLFGSDPTKPRTEFTTRASDGDLADLSQEELRARDWYYGAHVAQGAFGDLGVTHSGSRRVHRAFDMGAGHDASHWAQDLADAGIEMDNFIASLARSDEEVQTMAAAVQELSFRSGDAEKVIDHVLVERPLAALDAAGLLISDRFRHMGVEDFAAELAILIGVTDQLKFMANRLNVEFDLTADNALVVAERMSVLAGGLDNLTAMQESYYQTYFSDVERAAHLQDDLTKSLEALGLALPASRDGFRALVEAQDLNTESGQEAYIALLSLSGAYDQLNQALERQIDAAYQSALGREADTESLLYWMGQVTSGTLTLEGSLWNIANAADDAATGINVSADALRAQAQLERQLLQVQGNTAALRQLEIDELKELAGWEEAGLVTLQERIWALQDQQAAEAEYARNAQQHQRDTLNLINRIESARVNQLNNEVRALQQLNSLYNSLHLSQQSILDPAERLMEAQRQFADLQVRAEKGDTDAVSGLDSAATAYLDAASIYYGQSSSQYAAIFGDVNDSVKGLGGQFESSVDELTRLGRRIDVATQNANNNHLESLSALDQLIEGVSWLPEGLSSELDRLLNSGSTGGSSGGSTGGGSTGGSSGGSSETPYRVDLDVGRYNRAKEDFYGDPSKNTSWATRTAWQTMNSLLDDASALRAMKDYAGQVGISAASVDRALYFPEGTINNRGSEYGIAAYATGAWSVPGDQMAVVHDKELIVPSREGIANEFRAYAAGDYQRELMSELGAIQRSLPAPNLPAIQQASNPQADNQAALLRVFAGMRDDNKKLLDRVADLENQLSAIASNTGALIDPAGRTAEAAEKTERNSRTRKRNPA